MQDGTTKQRMIQNLGRKEVVEARSNLDRLARSTARLAQRSMVISLLEDGGTPGLNCRRIGAPLLFDRLWRETGCNAVIEELLRGRRFEFSVERAVFLTVLHRLVVSGSDRACEYWRDDYRLDGVGALDLHHLYRAMAWLGEELPAWDQPTAACSALHQGSDRGKIVRAAAGSVERSLRRVHGHDHPLFRRARRTDARTARPFEGLPAQSRSRMGIPLQRTDDCERTADVV